MKEKEKSFIAQLVFHSVYHSHSSDYSFTDLFTSHQLGLRTLAVARRELNKQQHSDFSRQLSDAKQVCDRLYMAVYRGCMDSVHILITDTCSDLRIYVLATNKGYSMGVLISQNCNSLVKRSRSGRDTQHVL